MFRTWFVLSGSEEMNAVETYFRVSWACKTPFVLMMDKRYEPWRMDELVPIVEAFTDGPYVAETHDCDDFAFALKGQVGHGLGIAWNAKHCWNIALCEDGVRHIEPQTGEFKDPTWAMLAII